MANGDIVKDSGVIAVLDPTAQADGLSAYFRQDQFGAVHVRDQDASNVPAALGGSYFMATNPTTATGIGGQTAPSSIVATNPLIVLQNTTTGTKKIVLDFLRLNVITGVGTNTTALRFRSIIDSAGTNRYTSGGSAITPVNVNSAGASTIASLHFGICLAAAAGANARLVDHCLVRSVIPVIGDTYNFTFGRSSQVISPSINDGTLITQTHHSLSPVVLQPGEFWLFHELGAAQTVARTYEFSMGWTER